MDQIQYGVLYLPGKLLYFKQILCVSYFKGSRITKRPFLNNESKAKKMSREELQKQISQVSALHFETLALRIFKYQALNNPLYRRFLELLKVRASSVQRIQQIPFLPIQLFKTHLIQTGTWKPERLFLSSGTTGTSSSRHAIRDLNWYYRNSLQGFKHFYGDVTNYCILALLPAYLERQGSSLVYMVRQLIERSGHPKSGFFLHNTAELADLLKNLRKGKTPALLIGVSFALLDFAEKYPMDLSNIILMETGGMKGRRKELTRGELHQLLKQAFNASAIHSEYGMTELLSQAYSKGEGRFHPSPSMNVFTREITDPLSPQDYGKTGGINIVDLANLDSCSFIATDDLGKVYSDNSFEILGRMDNSDIRGCNLLIS